MSNRQKISVLGGMVLLLLILSQLAMADDEIYVRYAYEVRMYEDGSTKVVPFSVKKGVNPADRTFDSATLIRPTRWTPGTKTVKFNFTEFASDFKKNVKKAANKYHNTKRGNSLVPRIKTTSVIDDVKDISTFNNPWEFYQQFQYDDKNTVVMTEDDQFFKSPNGIYFDPNRISIARVYSRATYRMVDGRYEGTYYIEDVDIELRSDFFDMAANLENLILTANFKYAMGYDQSMWTHDILGENNPFVDIDALKDKNSDVWQRMMHAWDDFYYKDKLGPAAFHTSPQVLPFNQEVIDIAGYECPPTDDDAINPTQASQVLFITNLKGYSGAKRLNITFTQVTLDKSNKEVKKQILAINGNAYDYPVTLSNGKPGYPTIWFNKVILGKESDLNKLKAAIKKDGTPMNMFGRNFDKLLRVDVLFKGRLKENGAVQQKRVTFYFTNSDE